jgi:single-strand DNA-binding protein
MRNSTEINFAGNLTDAPELAFAQSGTALARFTVAVNPRTFDQASGKWIDGEPAFHRVTAFGKLAENIAESFVKGDRVMVFGRLEFRTWEDRETKEKRSAWQVNADEVGASVAWATVKTTRATGRRDDVPPSDEWATASKTRPTAPASDSNGGEPPF